MLVALVELPTAAAVAIHRRRKGASHHLGSAEELLRGMEDEPRVSGKEIRLPSKLCDSRELSATVRAALCAACRSRGPLAR